MKLKETLALYFAFQIATFQIVAGGVNLLGVWIGPLFKPICFFNITLKAGLANGFLFIMLGIFVMKYLYICKWKTLRQLEDDFIARFILLTAFLIGFGLQLAHWWAGSKKPMPYVRLEKIALFQND